MMGVCLECVYKGPEKKKKKKNVSLSDVCGCGRKDYFSDLPTAYLCACLFFQLVPFSSLHTHTHTKCVLA